VFFQADYDEIEL